MAERRHPLRNPLLVIFSLLALGLTACSRATLVVGIEPTATLTPIPTPVVQSYINDAYGFSFRYPETWMLAEEPHRIRLSRGTLTLNIAYGWASDPGFKPNGGRTGLPAGDFLYGGKVSFLGQMIPVEVLAYERKDKIVFYGNPGLIEGDLIFSMWLEDEERANYADLDISEASKAEAQEILESFERIEATGSPPAPAPPSTPIADKELITYVNETYAFALIYPSHWELEEIPGGEVVPGGTSAPALHLTRDALRLTIQFKHPEEVTVLGPGGRAAGEIVEGGTVTLMGHDATKKLLVYEERVKSVFLSASFEDLDLYVQLDGGVGATQDYAAIQISEAEQAEMDAILSTLTRTGTSAPPIQEFSTYTNDAYGFSFQYPADWTIEEVSGEAMEDGVRLVDTVMLNQDRFRIAIQYRRKTDPAQIAWGGDLVPGGLGYAEATLGEPVTLLGEETHRYIWTYDDGIKAIAVSTTGKTTDLMLSITLADSGVRVIQDAGAQPIPPSVTAALDRVLNSLTASE